MAEDEDLQLLRATRPPQQPHQGEQVPDNEIHKRPEQAASLDHDTNPEPSELDTPERRGRVCEPYAFNKTHSSTAACATEVYDVSGILGNVRSGGLVGHGAIQVALTHHRRMIWGHCITYGATLSGNLSLSF
jgi:hypothetical protein